MNTLPIASVKDGMMVTEISMEKFDSERQVGRHPTEDNEMWQKSFQKL